MRTGPISLKLDPHCPRCDRGLVVAQRGPRGAPGLTLACPELYCDYTWTPTEGELARLMRVEAPKGRGPRRGPDVTRAAG
jgi:hypothetical protein